jgi:hypothetical protein
VESLTKIRNPQSEIHIPKSEIRCGTAKKQNEAIEIYLTTASFPMIYQVSTLVTSVGGYESPTEFFL